MPARRFGQPRFHFDAIDTTMREATERADAGAPEGTLVLAEAQTAGRGRLGRSWMSEPGTGLYFSLVLRPNVPAAQAPALTLALGLGVADGLAEAAGIRCDLRWPNDILLGDKKCAGILVEMSSEGKSVRYAVAGMGINVNQTTMPPELSQLATSLLIETGRRHDRDTVLDSVLAHAERYYEVFSGEEFAGQGAAPIIEAFSRKSSYVRGKSVVVENGESRLYGTTAGLDGSGVLMLETAPGRIEPIVSGSVRPWPGRAPRDET